MMWSDSLHSAIICKIGLAASMQRSIVGYHLDDHGHWVAELVCGHNQHVRHEPPFMNREWTTTKEGRDSRLGTLLECKLCDPTDAQAHD
jgi:hypothetical protein